MPDVSALLTFDEFIGHWGVDRPDRLALREEDRFWSYRDLEDRTARVASFRKRRASKRGSGFAGLERIPISISPYFTARRAWAW
ncbi:MAG: hypothetical protein ACKOAM_08215 [Chakrabartia sp.]